MMEIRIFTPELILAGVIETAEVVQLTRRLYAPGEFELRVHPATNYADKLVYGNIIMLDKDPERCGIIEYTSVSYSRGEERLSVQGGTLESLLHGRLTVPPSVAAQHYEGWARVRGPAETVMKHYVRSQLVNSEHAYRNDPRLVVATDLGRGIELPWQARFEYVDEVLADIYPYTKMGYGITLDLSAKKMVFDVIEGRDRTSGQSGGPRSVFSMESGNIQEMTYTVSHLEYANVGYAGGEGQEEDRLIYPIGSTSGHARRETFLDCGGANIDELIDTGTAKLAEHEPQTALDATVILKSLPDVRLGDYVTVQYKARGLHLDSQITEITESHEHGQTTYGVMFGTQTPTVMEKINALGGVR